MKIKAYAKINVTLNVIKKREDNFHELKMIVVPIDLYDELYFQKSEKDIIECSQPIPEKENIVYKVIKKIKEKYKIEKNIKVTVKKNIPIGGGLGGGSADAAATINYLNQFWKLNMSEKDKKTIALEVGSDVVFCLFNKPAIVTGRGENLEFIGEIKQYVALIIPDFSILTKNIFTNSDLLDMKEKNINEIIKNNLINDSLIFNDLEIISKKVYPEYKEILDQLKKIDSKILMSGSGAVCFKLATNYQELEIFKEKINRLSRIKCVKIVKILIK